jgi:pimeloyl-ACP methyl ester carboxylesterase
MRKHAFLRVVGILLAAFALMIVVSYLVAIGIKPELDDTARQAAPGEFVRLENGMVHFQVAGPKNGPTVVFVHGLATPGFVWDNNISDLANAGFRTIRYDHYGRGFSDRPKLDYSRDLYIRQLYGLLRNLNIKAPVNLVGLSMGGAVVIAFADLHPNLVDRICLIAPAGFPIEIPFDVKLATMPLIGEYLTAVIGDRLVMAAVRNAFMDTGKLTEYEKKFRLSLKYRGFHHALLSTLRHLDMHNMGENYRRVGRQGKAVLLIWGRQDRVLPFENSQKVLAAIPNADFQAIDDAGHNLNYENPEVVNAILRHFFLRTNH